MALTLITADCVNVINKGGYYMKCPNCDYSTEYEVDYELGEFYSLPVKMQRDGEYHGEQQETLYACPVCGLVFIST